MNNIYILQSIAILFLLSCVMLFMAFYCLHIQLKHLKKYDDIIEKLERLKNGE